MLKKQSGSLSESSFCLVGKDEHCVFEGVTVDFKAPFNLNKTSNSIMPTYFRDGNCYTPAFILARQKEYYLKNSKFEKINFEEKLFQAKTRTHQLHSEDTSLISVVAPTPENNHCQICKVKFVSYYSHIEQASHLEKVSSNFSNQYINQLCEAYSRKQLPPSKRQLITKRRTRSVAPKKYNFRLRRSVIKSGNLDQINKKPARQTCVSPNL